MATDLDARALVAWNLRAMRTALGFSQQRLAVEAGFDRSYIQNLEVQRLNPTITSLERITKVLKVSLADFFVPPVESEPPEVLRCGRKPRTEERRDTAK